MDSCARPSNAAAIACASARAASRSNWAAGTATLGLGNLLQVCHASPPDDWPGLIELHFEKLLTLGEVGRELPGQRLLASFETARPALRVRLWPKAQLAVLPQIAQREDLPGLATTLVLDLPEDIRALTWDDVARLAVPVDRLFACCGSRTCCTSARRRVCGSITSCPSCSSTRGRTTTRGEPRAAPGPSSRLSRTARGDLRGAAPPVHGHRASPARHARVAGARPPRPLRASMPRADRTRSTRGSSAASTAVTSASRCRRARAPHRGAHVPR